MSSGSVTNQEKPTHCAECGADFQEKKHKAFGRCNACYRRMPHRKKASRQYSAEYAVTHAAEMKIKRVSKYAALKAEFGNTPGFYNRTTVSRFHRVKAQAKKRNKPFELTVEQYAALIEPDCVYCDGFFGRTVVGIGLDRLDNTLGYTLSNCVSCCGTCNRIKGDNLTPHETHMAVQAIIQARNPNGTKQSA